MTFEEVGEVGRGKVIEDFVGDEQDLELNLLLYWEPVKLFEDGSDVFSRAGVGE